MSFTVAECHAFARSWRKMQREHEERAQTFTDHAVARGRALQLAAEAEKQALEWENQAKANEEPKL